MKYGTTFSLWSLQNYGQLCIDKRLSLLKLLQCVYYFSKSTEVICSRARSVAISKHGIHYIPRYVFLYYNMKNSSWGHPISVTRWRAGQRCGLSSWNHRQWTYFHPRKYRVFFCIIKEMCCPKGKCGCQWIIIFV